MPLHLASSKCRRRCGGGRCGGWRSFDRARTVEVVAEATVMASCDADLIRRVLENLISNAIKHTPSGGKVVIGVAAAGDRVRFTVQDAGPGIPVEARSRIFEKFGAMSARSDRSYHSVGLGLAFSKLAVEAHGGTIGIQIRRAKRQYLLVRVTSDTPPLSLGQLGEPRGRECSPVKGRARCRR